MERAGLISERLLLVHINLLFLADMSETSLKSLDIVCVCDEVRPARLNATEVPQMSAWH